MPQATSTLSPGAMELRTRITSSPSALACLVSTLHTACQHATSLALTLQQSLTLIPPPPSTPPPTAAPTLGSASSSTLVPPQQLPQNRTGTAKGSEEAPSAQQLTDLASAEQLLADVAMLLINLVDPTQLPVQPTPQQHPSQYQLVGDALHTAKASSRSTQGALGPVTCVLLPAVCSVAAWGQARGVLQLLLAGDGVSVRIDGGRDARGGGGISGGAVGPPIGSDRNNGKESDICKERSESMSGSGGGGSGRSE